MTEIAREWTFLTNHAHVLLTIAQDPTIRLRDIATIVGVTERAAQAIVTDLETDGYLHRTRVGRRNHYTINRTGHFRHPAEANQNIGELLALFAATTTFPPPPITSIKPKTTTANDTNDTNAANKESKNLPD